MSFNSYPKILQRNFGSEMSMSDLPYDPFPAHATCLSPYNNDSIEKYEDYEEPIDMSIKRKPETSHSDSTKPFSSNKYKSYNDESSSLSPITYSTAYLTHQDVISRFDSLYNPENLPPPPSYESTNKNRSSKTMINVKGVLQADNTSNSNLIKKISPDSVDPDIDEHFRRSLGINYNDFMVSESKTSATEPCDSVDDHFTKALGQTWIRLKNENKCFDSMPSGNEGEKSQFLTFIPNTDDHSRSLRAPFTMSDCCSSSGLHNKLNEL